MSSPKMMIKVLYLEDSDINTDGSLKSYVNKGKPAVLMVQGNFCPHCTTAKPAFVQLAKEMPNVAVLTIQTDGEQADQQAAKNISVVNKSRGVPAYLGFNKEGKFVKMHEGGRDLNSLKNFAMSL